MRNRLIAILLFSTALTPAHAVPGRDLVSAARTQIGVTVKYDPRYEKLTYPGGDVPLERGVCTDVVVRAYRKLGVDLQQLVHEDMRKDWKVYPKLWGHQRPDKNIDHRRVPNLATFFGRHGNALPVTRDGRDYRPGDIVTWMLPGNLPHIGIVADEKARDGTPLIVHNVGSGAKLENVLFAYPLTGHFRYGVE